MNDINHTTDKPASPPFLEPQNILEAKQNLKYYRQKCSLSQLGLANKLKVTQPTVNRWETLSNDKFIPHEKVEEVANALDISPRRFAFDTFVPSSDLTPRTVQDLITGEIVTLNITPQTIVDYKNNLRYYRLKRRISQRNLSKMLGMSPSMTSIWERPDLPSLPTPSLSQTIARILQADLTLICPDKAKPQNIETAPAVKPEQDPVNDLNRVYDDRSNVSAFAALSNHDTVLNMKTNAVGFAGEGYASELQFDQSIAELLGITIKDGLAAAKVVGQSMFNPATGAGIPDGAVVIIDTTKKDVSSSLGKVVCYMTNGYYMLKRLQCNKGVLNAASDNPNYFPIFYTNDQDVQLIGEVVCILSKPA